MLSKLFNLSKSMSIILVITILIMFITLTSCNKITPIMSDICSITDEICYYSESICNLTLSDTSRYKYTSSDLALLYDNLYKLKQLHHYLTQKTKNKSVNLNSDIKQELLTIKNDLKNFYLKKK